MKIRYMILLILFLLPISVRADICKCSYIADNGRCGNFDIKVDMDMGLVSVIGDYHDYETANSITVADFKDNLCPDVRAGFYNSGYLDKCSVRLVKDGTGLGKASKVTYSCAMSQKPQNDPYQPHVAPQIEGGCTGLFGSVTQKPEAGKAGSLAFYISFVFRIIKYIGIIILVVLSVMDFTGALASHDDEQLKKAMNKVLVRLALCIALFLLPILIDLIMSLIDKANCANDVTLSVVKEM